MNTWVKYTDDFNKAYPDTEITLLSVLSKRFKEETVVQMLIAAKKVPSTENLAVKIQAEQAKLWLSKGKTPAEVLALLHLGKQENSLFSNPLFTAWIEYTDEYNKIYFGTRNTAIPALKAYYNDDVLAKMILAAKKNPSTSSLSKRMYDELVRSWSTNKLAPQLVFSVLNLHKTGDRVLEQPLFSVWLRYLVAYSDANPRAKVTLLSQLSNIYGGNRLSKLLISAEKVPSTKRLASDLLSTQLQGWLTTKKDPVEVFFLLGVQGTAKNSVPNVLYRNYNAAFKQLKK
ncbi:hypothetical protein PF008_g22199 [Phytophthora fragariae]|uniref:RxLR effector PexRD54 WY domain-containing protein n=1 Tax=Phytophthora fragariae TaxID=53985 RepID=A0A6G0QV37_9STRA|nr:hypothetical protein PF008_g22199 [Phytophthora fragariae]